MSYKHLIFFLTSYRPFWGDTVHHCTKLQVIKKYPCLAGIRSCIFFKPLMEVDLLCYLTISSHFTLYYSTLLTLKLLHFAVARLTDFFAGSPNMGIQFWSVLPNSWTTLTYCELHAPSANWVRSQPKMPTPGTPCFELHFFMKRDVWFHMYHHVYVLYIKNIKESILQFLRFSTGRDLSICSKMNRHKK